MPEKMQHTQIARQRSDAIIIFFEKLNMQEMKDARFIDDEESSSHTENLIFLSLFTLKATF